MRSVPKLAITTLLIFVASTPMAQAANFSTSTSTELQSYPPNVPDAQKVQKFEVGFAAEDPDKVVFIATFLNYNAATNMAVNGNVTPLMIIKIFYSSSLSSSNNFQLNIDAPITP